MNGKLKRLTVAGVVAVTVAAVGLVPGVAGAKKKHSKPVTKTFTNGVGGQTGGVASAIPDGGGQLPQLVRSTINVKGLPKRGNIQHVAVGIRANHPLDDDLEFYLVTPRGVLDLSSDNGSGHNDYGSGATSCAGTMTVFDSNSPTSIATPGAWPYNGFFAPEESLFRLNGLGGKKVNNTTWTLIASDDQKGEQGTLFCWTLQIKMSNPK